MFLKIWCSKFLCAFFPKLKMATNENGYERLGNTKARRFQLTLNEVDKYEELTNYLTNLKSMTYMISCQEKAPTTGHEHIHIFVCFKTPIKLSLKKCCGAHIEFCKGSVQQNIDYISKDGNILDTIGEPPKERGGNHTVGELKKIKDPEDINWNEYKIWKAIQEDQNNDINLKDWYKPDIKVTYIWGDSGVGKSRYAQMKALEEGYEVVNIVKHADNFWHGIGSSECAIYDDFRPSDMKPAEFINFIDYNKHALNIKGGSKLNNYKRIFITSVCDPVYIYSGISDDEPRKQWLRRMDIIHLTKEDKNNDIKLDDDL